MRAAMSTSLPSPSGASTCHTSTLAPGATCSTRPAMKVPCPAAGSSRLSAGGESGTSAAAAAPPPGTTKAWSCASPAGISAPAVASPVSSTTTSGRGPAGWPEILPSRSATVAASSAVTGTALLRRRPLAMYSLA